MKISIIGASKGVGLEATHQALERGHQVVALARSENPHPHHPRLTKIRGDATQKPDLEKALIGAEAVLVTLGQGTKITRTSLFSDFAKQLVSLREEKGTAIPYIILTGFGAGDSLPYYPLFKRFTFHTILRAPYKDKEKMEEVITQSKLKWVIVRPGILNNHKRSNHYRVISTYYRGMKITSISRADVADFMITQAENPTFLYQFPALSD